MPARCENNKPKKITDEAFGGGGRPLPPRPLGYATVALKGLNLGELKTLG